MVAPNLKSETFSLMDRRRAIESEMDAIIARLSQPGGPGISGTLVDPEGFPRSDIDVHAVRADRNRLAELRNDHKDITSKIEHCLHSLHSARLTSNVSSSPKSSEAETPASSHGILPTDTSTTVDVGMITSGPFAIIDEIADVSPAAEDGLQLGDQILKFGNVESGDQLLPRLSSELQSNQGNAIPVIVLRHGTPINFSVTPRQWHGLGLLGCHFRIL
ncbi:hypothetical protein Sjap_010873 [Stephania japonica]|uniref:Nas2 N-terminal domain-containing protein n=1 Tax=Stephania japonica TaxID=461633 RepID=A0AAP0JA89_9MAGN